MSTLTKILCRNTRRIENGLNVLLKRQESGPSRGPTLRHVKQNLMELMGLELGYHPLQSNRDYLLKYLPKTQEELPPRTMQDSFCEAFVPLSTDVLKQEKYVTFLGHVRLGRLMEDMDMFAVWVAAKHISNPLQPAGVPTPYVLVTVLVDQVNFTDLVPQHNADIRLSGHVSWVGRSSIESVVWLEQEVRGQWVKLTRAIFLMAARNSVNTSAAVVNPLIAGSDYEKGILEGGHDRNVRRKRLASASLLKQLPDETEQHVIHSLFLKTVNFSDPTFQNRHLPPNSVWMRTARISNIVFCHPEDRNLHNKVFGGFLMRQALELSWTSAYLYSKVRPKLLHISDIGFFKPVDVGSLLQMHSHVIYTEFNYIMVLVHAQVLDPSGMLSTTNNFYYVYEMPEEVKSIVPESYHEAMLFLDGRRKFQYVMGLNKPPSSSNKKDPNDIPQSPYTSSSSSSSSSSKI
ncbi:hypothetical protein R5R35_012497 [Gryllus longicercus]|uniref:HotDog ACOT-type domain-containing protein n=1 Tax=Gryllus longicercus TaxID=2509291 RepID=A0AAN9VKF3_9ORTH